MVDRIKSNFCGDPRFFLAQRKFSVKDYTTSQTLTSNSAATPLITNSSLEEVNSDESLSKNAIQNKSSKSSCSLRGSRASTLPAKQINAVIEERIVLHRLPYMKMGQNLIHRVNIILFVLTALLAYDDEVLRIINSAIG